MVSICAENMDSDTFLKAASAVIILLISRQKHKKDNRSG